MHERDALHINGRLAARWARRTVERLRRERNDINAINVFPVADGDTGTNLYHTVRSAYRAVEGLRGAVTLGDVVSAMATGALRGARGNSGLILSVALRGVADALEDATDLDADTFAGALELAAARARDAVADPVAGTMLTVLEAMAAEAREQADSGADLVTLIAAVRETSQRALLDTTGQLPALSDANVVDAGSSGIVELFDLLYLTVTGADPAEQPSLHAATLTGNRSAEPGETSIDSRSAHAAGGRGSGTSILTSEPAADPGSRTHGAGGSRCAGESRGSHGAGGAGGHSGSGGSRRANGSQGTVPATASGTECGGHAGWPAGAQPALRHTGEQGFELVFDLGARRDRTRRVKKLLHACGGESIVVSWPLVHVHVPSEEAALASLRACADYEIQRLRVEDLSVAGGRAQRSTVIAVCTGLGMLFACALQEAHAVSADAQNLAELIGELVDAADSPVIIVPDSGPVLAGLRADYARSEATRTGSGRGRGGRQHPREPVSIVRSRSAAALLSALAVYDSAAAPEEAFEDMSESASATRVGGVVRAEKDSAGPLMYSRTDLLTIIDGRIRSVESDPAAAVIACADRLLSAGGEILTIVTGAQLPAAAVDALLRHIDTQHSTVTVDIVHSEHPAGCAVLGVE